LRGTSGPFEKGEKAYRAAIGGSDADRHEIEPAMEIEAGRSVSEMAPTAPSAPSKSQVI
jgi:hypothetical protein